MAETVTCSILVLFTRISLIHTTGYFKHVSRLRDSVFRLFIRLLIRINVQQEKRSREENKLTLNTIYTYTHNRIRYIYLCIPSMRRHMQSERTLTRQQARRPAGRSSRSADRRHVSRGDVA